MYEWCGVLSKKQHMLYEGLPLLLDIELGLVGNSATLKVMRAMHSGRETSRDGSKKKRGRKKDA